MILDKEVKDKGIDEKGERMVPAFHKGSLVFGEHLVRYESILPIVKDKVVLDIAAGSGYGTYIIANKAKHVYGVEIDEPSVRYAKKNYAKNNIEFIQGSAEKIPLNDASVDVVVTFETIEHIENYRKFLDEMKRVLKPGGIALISTPNDPEFPEDNHFHLHEFEYKELKEELGKYFKNVEFTFQYTWFYTAVLGEKEATTEWSNKFETDNYAPVPKEKAIYFMCVCSDESLKNVPKIKAIGAISEHWSARKAQDEHKLKLRTEARVKELEKEIVRVDSELSNVYNSKGWKLVSKLYNLKAKITRR